MQQLRTLLQHLLGGRRRIMDIELITGLERLTESLQNFIVDAHTGKGEKASITWNDFTLRINCPTCNSVVTHRAVTGVSDVHRKVREHEKSCRVNMVFEALEQMRFALLKERQRSGQ